eukprot:4767315-Amphidinium_carterae.1
MPTRGVPHAYALEFLRPTLGLYLPTLGLHLPTKGPHLPTSVKPLLRSHLCEGDLDTKGLHLPTS